MNTRLMMFVVAATCSACGSPSKAVFANDEVTTTLTEEDQASLGPQPDAGPLALRDAASESP